MLLAAPPPPSPPRRTWNILGIPRISESPLSLLAEFFYWRCWFYPSLMQLQWEQGVILRRPQNKDRHDFSLVFCSTHYSKFIALFLLWILRHRLSLQECKHLRVLYTRQVNLTWTRFFRVCQKSKEMLSTILPCLSDRSPTRILALLHLPNFVFFSFSIWVKNLISWLMSLWLQKKMVLMKMRITKSIQHSSN